MKRVVLAVLALSFVSLVGCDKAGDAVQSDAKGASSAALAGSGASAAAAPASVFAGTYRAAWGDTVFTQTGSAVSATYPGGSLSCTVQDGALDCQWKEGSASGKALLARGADGTIAGTWGNGESVKDGGKWSFTPKK